MIKIHATEVESTTVCKIEGKLSGIEGHGRIQDRIHALLDEGATKIVLDLTKVNWIDSTGLGELIATLSSVKKKDGNMVLSNIQGPVQSLMKMTNLNQIFDIYEDVEEAIAALQK